MDKEVLVELVIDVLKRAAFREKKRFTLLMVSFGDGSMDDFFSLIVSAPWLDEMTTKKAITYLLEMIKGGLTEEDLREFMGYSSILTLNTNDPLVRGITAPFGGAGTVFIMANRMIVNDENLGRCIVYEANSL